MRALTVAPGSPHSAKLEDVPDPPARNGAILVKTLALGICGTDREIIDGDYGWAPPGRERLILGHESLGVVQEAPAGCGFAKGDLIVGIVRRPDPVPCAACGAGEWDMCKNGRYTERGIKERDGYASDFFRVEPEFAVKADPQLGVLAVLTEPTSVVAKAWDHIERIGARTRSWRPRSVLVTGAGPVGLLAALLGVQRGYDVHVMDRVTTGPKPEIVRALGATYHAENFGSLVPDIVVECTGAPPVLLDVIERNAPDGIICLAGVSSGGYNLKFDFGGFERTMVLENDVIFGSVNANRTHYAMAADALAKADPAWLARLITRRVPIDRWQEALERRDDDIKVILDFSL